MSGRQPLVVVTGGGGGIGAAIAESLGRTGAFVVTLDPLVSVDGAEALPRPEETTAGRIVAAGGHARASEVSVTDAEAIRELFGDLAEEFGALDAVVNVAGISRPTSYGRGSDEDWRSVLTVHLDGYRNILAASLPLMAAAGHGHILGVTSGSGWRAADTGAYGCAKRAVASLTWQLGRCAPAGVVVNAISPIAATRMVAAALGQTGKTAPATTGGLSLGSMPTPEQLGPLGAHLVDDGFAACEGRVLFVGGSEVAVIDEPRLIEVVRTESVPDVAALLEAATTIALVPAQSRQATGGGSNARFGVAFDDPSAAELPQPVARSCAIVTDRPGVATVLSDALGARGVAVHSLEPSADLTAVADLDAVVVAVAGDAAEPLTGAVQGWASVLGEHESIVERVLADATWSRSAREYASAAGKPVRLIIVTDAVTSGGRTRAQASSQLARAGRKATGDAVLPFAVSAESSEFPADLVAHLVCSEVAEGLAGGEIVSGAGWFGLRSHPRPIGSISFGGPTVPSWFDDTLREVVRPR